MSPTCLGSVGVGGWLVCILRGHQKVILLIQTQRSKHASQLLLLLIFSSPQHGKLSLLSSGPKHNMWRYICTSTDGHIGFIAKSTLLCYPSLGWQCWLESVGDMTYNNFNEHKRVTHCWTLFHLRRVFWEVFVITTDYPVRPLWYHQHLFNYMQNYPSSQCFESKHARIVTSPRLCSYPVYNARWWRQRQMGKST